MFPRAVGGRSSSVWGCCWKPQVTAAVRMAVSSLVGSGWMRRARSMALSYWDQACLSCSRSILRGVVGLGPHPLGGWGEGWGW